MKRSEFMGKVVECLSLFDDFQVINQGRVYALRYELCDDLPREKDITDDDPRRTMWNTYSPIALFVSAQDFLTKRNKLVPVAIQMDYTPGSVYLEILSQLIPNAHLVIL